MWFFLDMILMGFYKLQKWKWKYVPHTLLCTWSEVSWNNTHYIQSIYQIDQGIKNIIRYNTCNCILWNFNLRDFALFSSRIILWGTKFQGIFFYLFFFFLINFMLEQFIHLNSEYTFPNGIKINTLRFVLCTAKILLQYSHKMHSLV
jgi:hypothetical protein